MDVAAARAATAAANSSSEEEPSSSVTRLNWIRRIIEPLGLVTATGVAVGGVVWATIDRARNLGPDQVTHEFVNYMLIPLAGLAAANVVVDQMGQLTPDRRTPPAHVQFGRHLSEAMAWSLIPLTYTWGFGEPQRLILASLVALAAGCSIGQRRAMAAGPPRDIVPDPAEGPSRGVFFQGKSQKLGDD
jgi:hypothetical protein